MKTIISIFSFLLFIVLAACNSSSSRYTLSSQQDLEFDFSGYSGVRFSGTLPANGRELIYFADVTTGKKVDFYTIDGTKMYSVPLGTLLDSGVHIESLYALAPDTIIAKAAYTGNVYFVNSKGKVWKTICVPDHFDDQTKFEATASSANNIFMLGNRLVFHCAAAFPESPDMSMEKGLRLQAHQSQRSPYFIYTDNVFTDAPVYVFSNRNFYSRFISFDQLSIEPAMYTCSDSNVYLFSVYNDTLYKLGNKNIEIEQAVKIVSKYTKIGSKPLSIHTNIGDSLNMIAQTGGLIINTTYDSYRKLYYLSVRHQVPSNSSKRKRANFSPWSIIVLDKDLNAQAEILLEAGKYNPGDLLVLKEGILLSLNKKDPLPQSVKFEFFHVEQN